MFNGLLRASIAVHDLDEGVRTFRDQLGLEQLSDVKESQRGFGLRWVELGAGGHVFFEVLAPAGTEGPVANYLGRHGEGVYQLRFGASDFDSDLDTAERRGARIVRDENRDSSMRRLAWLHPGTTHGALVEVVENPGDAQ